jgi:nickel-dependent lactate racemase
MPQPSPDAVAVATLGGAGGVLDDEAVRAFVHDRVGALDVAGRSVCVLVPDATRSCPLPLLLGAVLDALEPRASRVTVVVALGTHAPMAAERLAAHVGFDQRTPAATTTALNHAWWDPATFATVGTIDDATVARLTDGRLRVGTAVRVNRAVVEHDRTLVVGPVLPHEVVGFSGGTKYLFPGVSGQEMIDLSHWVGALVTSPEIIGTPGPTPVRALIDRAAALLRRPVDAVCVVT